MTRQNAYCSRVHCADAFALALALPVGCGWMTAVPPSAPSPLVGHAVPDFRRPTLHGETFDTAARRGDVVVVKFFATYCEPCKKTLPETERLHRERPELAIVGVDEDEHESEAREIVSSYGLTFPIVHDSGNVLSGRYRVSQMPMTFVVDKAGRVRWVASTVAAHEALGSAIDAVR